MLSSILTPASLVPVLAAAGTKAEKTTTTRITATVKLSNAVPAQQAAIPIVDAGRRAFSIFSGIRRGVIAFLVIALVFFGIGCIIGDDSSRARFRSSIPWVLLGVMLVMFALTIASTIFNSFYGAGS